MANNYPNYQFTQQAATQLNPTQPQSNFQMAPPQYAQQPASFFLQPVGNIYSLNTASEINNVPAGANISVGLCIPENIMYIKSFQNGAPMLLGYRLSPIEGAVGAEDSKPAEDIKQYLTRLEKVEKNISKIQERMGGKLEWQI